MTTTTPIATEEDLDAFRSAIRRFLTIYSPLERTRELTATEASVDTVAWNRAAADLGIPGLLVSEDLGGSGGSVDVAAVAASELGSALAIGPYLPTIIAGAVLAGGSPTSGAAEVQGALTSGEARFALDYRSLRTPLTAIEGRDGVHLSGPLVAPDLLAADYLLTGVRAANATGLAVLPLTGLDIEPLRSLDLTRRHGRVHVDDRAACLVVDPTPAEVATPTGEPGLLARTRDLAGLLLAAEQAAIIERVIRDDAAYFLDREAFGRMVGSFQAVKHQLADLYCAWEQAVALRDHAVTVFEDPTRRSLAVDQLQCFVTPAAVTATTVALRLLGGIGFTWEHQAHLYLRRARADSTLLEDPHRRRSRLAARLGLKLPREDDQ